MTVSPGEGDTFRSKGINVWRDSVLIAVATECWPEIIDSDEEYVRLRRQGSSNRQGDDEQAESRNCFAREHGNSNGLSNSLMGLTWVWHHGIGFRTPRMQLSEQLTRDLRLLFGKIFLLERVLIKVV